jgi:hypothetical protein
MHEDGFSHSMIKKMISYGGGLFKYCLKHRDALGRQLLKAHPWVGIELEEYGVPLDNPTSYNVVEPHMAH